MSWDLAISPDGDLIFAANNDLQAIGGTALLEQRMRLRLKLERGSWIYEPALGSDLKYVLTHTEQNLQTVTEAYVRQALQDMPDIQIDYVDVERDTATSLLVVIGYHPTNVGPEFSGPATSPPIAVSIPVDVQGAV